MFGRRNIRRKARLGNRRRKIRTIKLGIAVVIIAFVAIGIVWLSRIDEVNIKTVSIIGNSAVTKVQLEAVVEEQLRGTYALLFPRSNILLFPRNSITAGVLNSFDRIFDAEIVVEDLQTIKLIVRERQPFALYCGDTFIDTHEILGHCYFLDEKGFIFAKAPDFSGNIFFKYFGTPETDSEETSHEPLGLEYMSPEKFRGVILFLGSFEELDLKPTSFTRLSGVDFKIRFKDGSYILFGGEQTLASVLDNLQSVLGSEVFQQRDNVQLDYIDMRFGNKVYYKFFE